MILPIYVYGSSVLRQKAEEIDVNNAPWLQELLDDMHKRKIDMADEIFVINVGGYIGDSTRSEIQYAKMNGKKVNYLE